MKVVKNPLLPPKGYKAITLLNFIFCRKDNLTDADVRHESIHWEQEKETLVVGFYLWYVAEFLVRLVRSGFDWKHAYRSVSFEQEAYYNERDGGYLKARRRWAWTKWLGTWFSRSRVKF